MLGVSITTEDTEAAATVSAAGVDVAAGMASVEDWPIRDWAEPSSKIPPSTSSV